ncbi:MAG: HAMP domain-containing protein [Deltaproteobacteria bacterium]|nr:HAMP domain-containing protein [Deltaproteobacteria bacterium]
MRSLFLRIFIGFMGGTVLVGILLLVLALTARPERIVFKPHEERLSRIGQELVAAYRAGGAAALRKSDHRREQTEEPPAVLFRNGGAPLSGREVPQPIRQIAAETAVTGKKQAQRGPHGLPLIAMPLGDGFVLVAGVPAPTPLERFFNPYGLTVRLGAAFLVAGLLSWILARSISSPIRTLQDATKRLADGDLSSRVVPSLGGRRDETAELGRDFDRMAERIGGLIDSQRRLLRDISHELRSPLARLNVALGLARKKAGAEAQPALDRMEREAERLNGLIGELLTLSLLESDTRGIERVPVDLQLLVREIAADADFEADGANRKVRVVQEEPAIVAGVQELLRRAIENVVRNAVRFTPEGTVVEIRLSRSGGHSRPGARISVRDRGPGVPEESLEKLFEPFYRVADARDRQTGGTGIGLAITRRAIRLHGGTVRASNDPEGGLNVVLELPAT